MQKNGVTSTNGLSNFHASSAPADIARENNSAHASMTSTIESLHAPPPIRRDHRTVFDGRLTPIGPHAASLPIDFPMPGGRT